MTAMTFLNWATATLGVALAITVWGIARDHLTEHRRHDREGD